MDQKDLEGLGVDDSRHLRVTEEQGYNLLFLDGKPYMKWTSGDELSQRIAIVQLHELGLACQEDIAAAFGVSSKSVYNYSQTFTAQGADGFVKKKRGPKGSWRINPGVRSKIVYIFLTDRGNPQNLFLKSYRSNKVATWTSLGVTNDMVSLINDNLNLRQPLAITTSRVN